MSTNSLPHTTPTAVALPRRNYADPSQTAQFRRLLDVQAEIAAAQKSQVENLACIAERAAAELASIGYTFVAQSIRAEIGLALGR